MHESVQPLVSIVTPFYNSGDFLAECIESVLAQTYQNFEYILFDNCSTDASAGIAMGYADLDPRIRYVKAETFVDQVPNYNRALRQISGDGKYCKMVQADDWIYETCIEEMVRLAEKHSSIGVVGSYSVYGHKVAHDELPLDHSDVITGHEAIRHYLVGPPGGNFIGSPTCVMFRSDLVRERDPFFTTDMPDYEDLEVCLELLLHCDFGFVCQVLTFNRRDNESIWSRIAHLIPGLAHQYLLMKKYGPKVLAPDAYSHASKTLEYNYYIHLAKASVRLDREYLRFHSELLGSEGVSINKLLLAREIVMELINILGNPKMSLGRLVRHIMSR